MRSMEPLMFMPRNWLKPWKMTVTEPIFGCRSAAFFEHPDRGRSFRRQGNGHVARGGAPLWSDAAVKISASRALNSGRRARTRARVRVSREMVANCSRPVRLLQLMLMPVKIATRASAGASNHRCLAGATARVQRDQDRQKLAPAGVRQSCDPAAWSDRQGALVRTRAATAAAVRRAQASACDRSRPRSRPALARRPAGPWWCQAQWLLAWQRHLSSRHSRRRSSPRGKLEPELLAHYVGEEPPHECGRLLKYRRELQIRITQLAREGSPPPGLHYFRQSCQGIPVR